MKNCLRNVMLLVLALMLAICPAIAEEAAPEPELTTTPAAVLNVGVTLQGTLPKPPETYTIVLTADNESYPMPAENQVLITGEGSGAFGEIVYSKPGVYTYTIHQVPGEHDRCLEYDPTIYSVTVYCTNVNPQNPDGNLELTVTMYAGEATEKCDLAVFHNVYTIVSPPGGPTPTGVEDYWQYYLSVCAVMLVVSGVLLKTVCTKEPVLAVAEAEEAEEAEDDE